MWKRSGIVGDGILITLRPTRDISDFINNSAASSGGPPPTVSPFLSVNFNKTSQDDADYDEYEIHK